MCAGPITAHEFGLLCQQLDRRLAIVIAAGHAQFEDFAKTEKISRLSKRLSTDGRTTDYEANVWDVTYYVPWGNIAVFYENYEPSKDLIRMGRIVSGQEAMTRSDSFSARIELAK